MGKVRIPCIDDFPHGPPDSIVLKLANKLLVRKFCCCISLKVGCIIIGVIQAMLAVPVGLFFYPGPDSDHANYIAAASVIVGIFFFCYNVELVFGIVNRGKSSVAGFLNIQIYILAWFVLILTADLGVILLLICSALAQGSAIDVSWQLNAFGLFSLLSLIVGYTTVIVYSHYKQMEEPDDQGDSLVEA